MIEKIKQIIDLFPNENNYLRLIKSKDKDLYKWVCEQNKEIADINERIYLLLNEQPLCPSGNKKKFLNFRKGYGYCSTADKCLCLKDACRTSLPITDYEEKLSRTLKIKSTKEIRYGDKNFNNREKSKNTLKRNFGVENPMHSQQIKNLHASNNLKKYGVDNPAKLQNITEKQRITSIERHGDWVTRVHLDAETKEKLSDIEYLKSQNKVKSLLQIATDLKVSDSLIYKIFKKNNIDFVSHINSSVWENEIYDFVIGNTNFLVERNNRTCLIGRELDIFIPSLKFAIECNGSYWHSELNGKDSKYHLSKTVECLSQGIKLLHIWEHEYYKNEYIVKSIILNSLGKTRRIYARDCYIKDVEKDIEEKFL